jgi:hypothetical protein
MLISLGLVQKNLAKKLGMIHQRLSKSWFSRFYFIVNTSEIVRFAPNLKAKGLRQKRIRPPRALGEEPGKEPGQGASGKEPRAKEPRAKEPRACRGAIQKKSYDSHLI